MLAFIYTTISNSILFSAVFAGIVVIVQVLLRLSNQIHGHVLQQNGLLDDGEVELDGNPILATLEYSFKQQPKSFHNYVLDAMILWGVLFGSFHLISMNSIQSYTQNSLVLFVFDWLSICLSTYPVLAKPMVEPNTYHTDDPYLVDVYSRIFVVGSILIVFYLIPSGWILILLAIVPIGWIIGMIPALRIILMTIMERGVVVVLGGTPSQGSTTAVLQLLVRSTLVTAIVVLRIFTNQSIFIISSVAVGWLASQRRCLDAITFLLRKNATTPLMVQTTPGKVETIKRLVQWVIAIGITIALVYLQPLSRVTLEYIILIPFATQKFLSEVQQQLVPSLFPLFVNPIRCSRTSRFSKILGIMHMIVSFMIPWAEIAFVTFHVLPLTFERQIPLIWNTVLTIRLYSIVWSYTAQLHLSLLVYAGMVQFVPNNTFLNAFTFPEYVLLIDLALNLLSRMYQKMAFWMILLYHFVVYKKERHRMWMFWLPLSALVSPMSIVISSILDAPCMPFLGLPLMIPSFPRPERFWTSRMDEYKSGNDTILYTSMTPTLLRSITMAVKEGRLPNLAVADVFLCRFESRLLVLRCIESWNDGNVVEVIATELEPTSCHALEGVAVDDTLNAILSPDEFRLMNPDFLRTMTPIGIVYCAGYMESVQTTTGIIDGQQFQFAFVSSFFRFLIYEFLIVLSVDPVLTHTPMPIQKQIIQVLQPSFPSSWFQYVKDKSVSYRIKIQTMLPHQIKEFDSQLMNVVMGAFALTMGSSNQAHIPLSSSNLFDLYRGVLPFTLQGDAKQWLLRPACQPFRSHCLHAYRNAFKFVYDAIVLQDTIQDDQELFETISNIRQNWVCSVESTQALPDDPSSPIQTVKEALERQCSGVFLLSQPKPQQPVKVRLLKYSKECEVKIASVNPESIKVQTSEVGNMGQFEL
jgi:hypothetical protein